jgi:hypothetical protein
VRKKEVLSPILFNGMMGKFANKVTGEKQQYIKTLIFADNMLISGKIKRKLKENLNLWKITLAYGLNMNMNKKVTRQCVLNLSQVTSLHLFRVSKMNVSKEITGLDANKIYSNKFN